MEEKDVKEKVETAEDSGEDKSSKKKSTKKAKDDSFSEKLWKTVKQKEEQQTAEPEDKQEKEEEKAAVKDIVEKKEEEKKESATVSSVKIYKNLEAPKKTMSDEIWDKIENARINIYAIPNQRVKEHVERVKLDDNILHLRPLTPSVLPSLEAVLADTDPPANCEWNVDVAVNGMIIVTALVK